MASWRDADDPSCPFCDEPVSATATYCMHCGEDLDAGDPDDPTASDDISAERLSGEVGAESGSDDESVLAGLLEQIGFNQTTDPANADVSRSAEHDQRGEVRSDPGGTGAGSPGGTPGQAGGVGKASLALRAPTAFVVSLPIAFVLLFVVLPSVGQLSGSLAGTVWFAAWIGSIAYLVRKPLPSDIIGDAFFVYAGLLLAIPLLIGAALLGNLLVDPAGAEESVGDIVMVVVVMEFTFAFPAAVLAAIGAFGNWWAERRLTGG